MFSLPAKAYRATDRKGRNTKKERDNIEIRVQEICEKLLTIELKLFDVTSKRSVHDDKKNPERKYCFHIDPTDIVQFEGSMKNPKI